MSLGKYLTNLGLLGTVAGAYGVVKQTKNMPNDWRRFVVWGIWLLGVVLAIAGIAKEDEDSQYRREVRGGN